MCVCVCVCVCIVHILLRNVKQVLLEGVPIGDETVHLLSTQTHYGGTPVHRRWTHGSAEYRGNRPKLAGAQVIKISNQIFACFCLSESALLSMYQ